MTTTPRSRRRISALAAASLGLTAVAIGFTSGSVSADAADPVGTTYEITVNDNDTDDTTDDTYTVTVSGTWVWTTHDSDCNIDRFATGWEVDWDDPDQPGNPIGSTGVDVGALAANEHNPADNTVDYYAEEPRCGVYDPDLGYNSGTWGPISHTYGPGTDLSSIEPCVVTYDVHYLDSRNPDLPKPSRLIAGGSGRNKDNSVESNGNTPAGNQCAPLKPPVGSLTLNKIVDNTDGGSLTADDFTLTATPLEATPAGACPSGHNSSTTSTTVACDEEDGFVPEVIEGTDGVSGDALGQYTLSETDATDYVGGSWDCGSATVVDDVVTVGPGQDITCTITNTFVPSYGTLTLNKVVDNNGGGVLTVDDFTLTATEVDVDGFIIDGGQLVEGTDGVNDEAVGYFLLTETDDADYEGSDWDCGDVTVVDGVVEVVAGEDVSCTITNTYTGGESQPPTPPTTLPREIPETGGNSGTSLLAALLLCGLGGLGLLVSRRRRVA